MEFEGTYFSSTGDIGEDLLAITAVHPMREDAVREFLACRNGDWNTVRELIAEGCLVATDYRGSRFYLMKIPGRNDGQTD